MGGGALSVQNGCISLVFRVFCRVSVGSHPSPLQCQNPSYIIDHYPFSAKVSQYVLVDLLVARDKCWNYANAFLVHPKDALKFVKVIERGLESRTSVALYIISQR